MSPEFGRPEEIAACLSAWGFAISETSALWERDDGVVLGDTHDRNFIRAPDERVYAIDVQPKLLPGFAWESVRPLQGRTGESA